MHIQADRALIPAGTPSVRHLHITIATPPAPRPAHERPAVSVALVLDRSGSMDGQKFEMARNAVAHSIALLDARDRLALVVYNERVDVVCASAAGTSDAKAAARQRLAAVNAGGSTNLAGGWFAGADQVRSDATRFGRVLLLTDGLANQGLVDPQALAEAAARFRGEGIVTSTFGVGADFDEELLARLATEGGGHFYFIESARQIPDFLASELGETLEIVARDVVLDLTCAEGLSAHVLNGFAVAPSAGRVRVRLGDLVADQEVSISVAVACAPHPPEAAPFVDCRVTDRDGVLYREPMRIEWRAATIADDRRQPVNSTVLVAAATVMAAQARAAALAARRGHFEDARRIVIEAIERLRALTPASDAILEIIRSLEQDGHDMMRALPLLESKLRHFASYSASRSRDPQGKARRKK